MKWPFAFGDYHRQTRSRVFVTSEKSGPAQTCIPCVFPTCILSAGTQSLSLLIHCSKYPKSTFPFMPHSKFNVFSYCSRSLWLSAVHWIKCPLQSLLHPDPRYEPQPFSTRQPFETDFLFFFGPNKSNNQWFSLPRTYRVLKDPLGNRIYFLA